MTTKHTPGPWQVTNTMGKVAITIPHNSIGIAPYIVCHIWPHIEKGEPDANARLIAAAPELLEAAKKALEDCVDLIATEAGIALEKAIAKAEGR